MEEDVTMEKKINILGVKFDNITMSEAVNKISKFMDGNVTKCIYTPNPEIVMLAQKDAQFMDIMTEADMIVPDGIGIIKAAKMLKTPLKEKVGGCDLSYNLLEYMSKHSRSVFLFGAAPGTADKAAENMKKKFPGLIVAGTHNGYFKKEDEAAIIEQINNSKPDLLLVALGAPKQEKWIFEHKNTIQAKVCIGVGGTLDIMAGNLRRAPKWMLKLNLEWLYRFVKQPTRFKRFLELPKFVIKVFVTKGKRGE
jgi:N-acetylglucosaminyldiphosphoundecaprenol N-acetyl-beta-D-mannosaminyltransferase